jgi:hypothetical protein
MVKITDSKIRRDDEETIKLIPLIFSLINGWMQVFCLHLKNKTLVTTVRLPAFVKPSEENTSKYGAKLQIHDECGGYTLI